MKIFTTGSFNKVKKIEFCCSKLAEDILLRRVRTNPWTDHPLHFWALGADGNFLPLAHCPHCGAKIECSCLESK